MSKVKSVSELKAASTLSIMSVNGDELLTSSVSSRCPVTPPILIQTDRSYPTPFKKHSLLLHESRCPISAN